jgi:hypothetical protein
VDGANSTTPATGSTPITAASLNAIRSVLVAVWTLANNASSAAAGAAAAVETNTLRAFIRSIVRAMLPSFAYDATTGVLTSPASTSGGTTQPTQPTQPIPAAGEVLIETNYPNAGTGGDDTIALNTTFAQSAGKVVKLANKTYRHNNLLTIATNGITIDGSSGGKIVATNQALSSMKITGDDVTLRDLQVELTSSTQRFDPYPYQLLLIDGANNFTAIRVITRRSAATGMYITRTNGFTLTDCTVEDSRADGFHITGGSTNGKSTNCLALRPGDDGHAVVSYVGGSDGGVCSDIELIAPKVRQQTVRGRGCTVVGGTNVVYRDVDIDGTWGPGIYVAAEPYGNNPTNGVNNVQFLGGTIRNAHSTTAISNGSILIASSRSGISVSNVTIQGITTYGTRKTLPFEFGAYSEGGGLLSEINLQGLKAVDGSTGTLLYTNQPTTIVKQSDVTKSTSGGSAGAVLTTVRITSTTVTSNSATVSWAPLAGTDGATLSGVTSTITGGTQVNGAATDSRTFTALDAGQSYTVSIQPLRNGQPYGNPVTTTVAIPTGNTAAGVLTSDYFSGSGEIIGRSTDVGGGGSARTWGGEPLNGFVISNGALTRGTNAVNSVANISTGALNVEISVTLKTLPTGDGIFLDLHRQLQGLATPADTYRCQVIVTGALRLQKRIGGVMTELANMDAKGFAVAGDTLLFRYSQGRLEVLLNGTLMASVPDTSITTAGFAGLAATSATTGLSVDNFTLATAASPAGA